MKKSEKKRLEKQIKLQKQAEADRYLARTLRAENKKLKEQVAKYAQGFAEVNRALDAILAEVAVKYGEKHEDAWVAAIGLPSTLRNSRDYRVSTRVGEDNDSYVIRAVWIGEEEKDETHDHGDAAGSE